MSMCSGCSTGDISFANKFYLNTVWTGDGAKPSEHGASKSTLNGKEAYKYNIIVQG